MVNRGTFVFRLLGLGVLWTFLFGLSTADADRIEFGKGNILYGTVKSLKGGTLIFTNEFSQKTKIPFANIRAIETDKTVSVELIDGSILAGRMVMLADGRFGVELDSNKESVSFDWKQVKYINKPKGSWTGNVSLGGTVQTGNVERTSISFGGETKREWERDRFAFRMLYNYAEEDGTLAARNTFGAMKFDHFFTDNFFSALSLELLKDDFKDLNLRAIVGLGLGYRIWNDDVKTLELEAGVTYFSEDLDMGMDEQFMSGRIGITYSYNFFEAVTFKDYMLYYPSFEDPKKYRLRNEASLISQLGFGWAVRVSHIFDQNSNPAPGVKDKDHQFIFSIQYSF